MKFALVGGDARSEWLARALVKDGHRVRCFAMDKADIQPEMKSGCLPSCVYGADCVVLPIPAERGGYLNTAPGCESLPIQELLSSLWQGQLVCGGKFSEESREAGARLRLDICDIMQDAEYSAMNAALTAEGALALLIENSTLAISGSRILICGWGRIGKTLALKLKALDGLVTVAERNARALAEIKSLGLTAAAFPGLEGKLSSFSYIINTIPARILNDPLLCQISDSALLLELASPPGGFDMHLAGNIGLHVLAAPGLPGRFSPGAAAELIKEAVYRAIGDREE